ncbi:tRNA/rRNA methyltransferase (SpoU) family protein [Wolffia australiana]
MIETQSGLMTHLISFGRPIKFQNNGHSSSRKMAIPQRNFLCFFPSADNGEIHERGRRRRRESSFFVAEKQSLSSTHPSEIISSPANPFIKHCVKLRQSSSYRRSCGFAVVVGLTPIREIAARGGVQKDSSLIDLLLLIDSPDGKSSIEFGLSGDGGDSLKGVRVVKVSANVMKKLAGLQSTESTDAVAVVKIPPTFRDLGCSPGEELSCSSWFYSPPHRILVLDGIQDPGNIGTLLRSAMAFNWDGVFLLPGCCDPFNEKALRAARGASFQLPIFSGTWAHVEALRAHFGTKMLAAHPEDTADNSRERVSLSLSDKMAGSLEKVPLCLVLGSEGQGLSQEAINGSELVTIPMAGDFESLNVSVAGGIFMFSLQNLERADP